MRSQKNSSKRIFRRVPARIPVALSTHLKAPDVDHGASIVQLSFLGARVKTGVPLKPGQSVQMIRLTGSYAPVPASVAWVGALKSAVEGHVGLKFTDPLRARISVS